MELVETEYTPKDMRDAAERILDQAIIQTGGAPVFQELEFGYAGRDRVYVTDDQSRLTRVTHRIERDGKTYFLGIV